VNVEAEYHEEKADGKEDVAGATRDAGASTAAGSDRARPTT
jgi:hypothetical protein